MSRRLRDTVAAASVSPRRPAAPPPPSTARHRVAALVAAALATVGLAGCGSTATTSAGLPQRVLPAALDGLTVSEEKPAEAHFKDVQDAALSRGTLYSLRLDTEVRAALEVATIDEGSGDASDIDAQERIRHQIGTGAFLFIRLGDQWVAERQSPDQALYVWFQRARPDVLEVLTVAPDQDHPRDLASAIIRYQETGR